MAILAGTLLNLGGRDDTPVWERHRAASDVLVPSRRTKD